MSQLKYPEGAICFFCGSWHENHCNRFNEYEPPDDPACNLFDPVERPGLDIEWNPWINAAHGGHYRVVKEMSEGLLSCSTSGFDGREMMAVNNDVAGSLNKKASRPPQRVKMGPHWCAECGEKFSNWGADHHADTMGHRIFHCINGYTLIIEAKGGI